MQFRKKTNFLHQVVIFEIRAFQNPKNGSIPIKFQYDKWDPKISPNIKFQVDWSKKIKKYSVTFFAPIHLKFQIQANFGIPFIILKFHGNWTIFWILKRPNFKNNALMKKKFFFRNCILLVDFKFKISTFLKIMIFGAQWLFAHCEKF